MRPTRTTELPLHNGGPKKSNITKLNNAFEKGLDMAGLKKTKTGAGDKTRAYIMRENTCMKVLLSLIILGLITLVAISSIYLEINIVRRGAVHSEAVHRSTERQAQLRLLNVHLQLQQALDMEVHETYAIEEHRAFTERVLGDTANEVRVAVAKIPGVEPQTLLEVNKVLESASEKVVENMNTLLHSFAKKAKEAKEHLIEVSDAIVKDIRLDDEMRKAYRERMVELGMAEDFDYKEEAGDDAPEEDPNEFLDTARVEKEVNSFYKKLQHFEFPIINPTVIKGWEQHLNKLFQSLEDENQEADLDKMKEWFNSQLAIHAPKVKPFEPSASTASIIDFVEDKMYSAKMAPHRQEMLDMYSGWKAGKLTVLEVLANLEQIAQDENLYLIYDWLHGDLSHTYYHDGETVTATEK